MEKLKFRNLLIERRLVKETNDELWSHLTLAQKFSVNDLQKYGYELAFIRCFETGNIAVMLREGNTTIITCEGDINTSSDIIIR